MDDVSDQYSPADVEAAAEAHWDEHDAYEATKAAHADDPTFFLSTARRTPPGRCISVPPGTRPSRTL